METIIKSTPAVSWNDKIDMRNDRGVIKQISLSGETMPLTPIHSAYPRQNFILTTTL